MPVTGRPDPLSEERASAFSHDNEVSTPAYYAVQLDRYRIKAEMTALQRAAIFRFDYQGDENRERSFRSTTIAVWDSSKSTPQDVKSEAIIPSIANIG